MIEIKNLSKRFNDVAVFENLSYSFDGKILGICGDKSSGKTTLLSIICGVIPPSEGEVLVCGKDLSKDTKLANSTVGYCLESFPSPLMPGEMTPVEFLKFVGEAKGISPNKLSKQIDSALDIVSLVDVKKSYINSLTFTQRKMLGVAQALLGNPDIIVLDDPFTGLAKHDRRVMKNIILTLSEIKTIIISYRTEDMCSSICTETITLNRAVENESDDDTTVSEEKEEA